MTIHPITILGACLCFGLLYQRYKSRPKNRPPRTPIQRLRVVRVLLVVFLAWMAVSCSLQHFIRNLDGVPDQKPSLLERIVSSLHK
jgi:hypothetical protein